MLSVNRGKVHSRKYECLFLGIVAGAVLVMATRAMWVEFTGQHPDMHPMVGFYFVPVLAVSLFVIAGACEAVIARLLSQPTRRRIDHVLIGLSWSTPLAFIIEPLFGVVAVLLVNPLTLRFLLRKKGSSGAPPAST